MAFDDFQAKQRLNKLKAVVREYFTKRNGHALCLTDDPTFATLLRNIIKDLAISQPGLLTVIPDPSRALKVISEAFAEGKKPVIFIERVLPAIGDTGFLIRQFKDTFPELRIIVMTTTADKDRIMLLHESGADNFVLKPISANDLTEKMGTSLAQPAAKL